MVQLGLLPSSSSGWAAGVLMNTWFNIQYVAFDSNTAVTRQYTVPLRLVGKALTAQDTTRQAILTLRFLD